MDSTRQTKLFDKIFCITFYAMAKYRVTKGNPPHLHYLQQHLITNITAPYLPCLPMPTQVCNAHYFNFLIAQAKEDLAAKAEAKATAAIGKQSVFSTTFIRYDFHTTQLV